MAGDLIAQLAQNIVEQANDSIVFADPQGTIRLWNAGAEAMWGYTVTEAVGQRLDLIVPERFRADHWAGYESAMVHGQTKNGYQLLPTRSMRKDGVGIYLEMALTIIRDGANQVIGALAIARDITERRAQERAQRDRMAGLEQQVAVLFRGGGVT